jgi:hypothetical protein
MVIDACLRFHCCQSETDEALRDVSGVRSSNLSGRMTDGETRAANFPTVHVVSPQLILKVRVDHGGCCDCWICVVPSILMLHPNWFLH